MKTFLTAVACVTLLSASSLLALAGDPQASLPPPAAIGKCKTDAALKRKCTAAWDHCVRLAAAHPKCKEHWATCCAPSQ